MKTKLILLLVLALFFASCDNENDITTPEPKPIKYTVYEYVYTGKHEIKDFNVYIGPKGEKLEMEISYANHFWGEHSLLGRPYYDSIKINKEKDSLYLEDREFSSLGIDFPLQLLNDTLKYNDFEYWGVFKNDSTFVMNRAHYFINYNGRETDWNDYSHIDHYGYWRYHEKARINEFFHENSSFRSLSDMTFTTDTIAWLTQYYEFKLSKRY